MLEPVKSTDELAAHIGTLEQRIARLEAERATGMAGLPQTGLLSPNFLTRAFTIWGHYFVASLIIAILPLTLWCLFAVVFGGAGILNNLLGR